MVLLKYASEALDSSDCEEPETDSGRDQLKYTDTVGVGRTLFMCVGACLVSMNVLLA